MLTIELFFFEIRNYTMKGVINKRRLFKLASNQSVKTACVCIFFFHYFKYYGQNVFSRITVLYLIAKVEKKKLFNLKHEIILRQKEKRSKMFFRLR